MKDVERVLGISYPTVKSKLAKLNKSLAGEFDNASGTMGSIKKDDIEPVNANKISTEEKMHILELIKNGELDVVEAKKLLKGESRIEIELKAPESVNNDEEE